ncbi:hypothetical protein KSP39_PZI015851 [Platanthera zijinensis]|uniref:R3H domain-containing protein n=1 Tax=Platanthera zijinensis TaxID=2320716 RepID=A0AAP0B8H4_9ASPA
MSPYQRLLLHRLAEIYGFAHESVGEGEERHLLLERCPETAIPPILVSDILWQYGDYQSAAPANLILRRKESPGDILMLSEKEDKAPPSSTPLEVREAAYLAARERIFSLHEADEKESVLPKSRKVPVVAQRMIAHALGQKVSSLHIHEKDDKNDDLPVCAPINADEISVISETRKAVPRQKKGAKFPAKTSTSCSSLEPELKPRSSAATHRKTANSENLEKERIVAAKRIFAQALGIASSNRGQDVALRTSEDGTTLSH